MGAVLKPIEEFMNELKKKTATAIIEAYRNRADGKLYFSKIETEDLQYDCRTPETYDRNLNRIHFVPDDKTKKEIIVVNFASHAELLGSKTKKVSADFPCYMIKEIEENHKKWGKISEKLPFKTARSISTA